MRWWDQSFSGNLCHITPIISDTARKMYWFKHVESIIDGKFVPMQTIKKRNGKYRSGGTVLCLSFRLICGANTEIKTFLKDFVARLYGLYLALFPHSMNA